VLPLEREDDQASDCHNHQREDERLAPCRLGAAVLGVIVPAHPVLLTRTPDARGDGGQKHVVNMSR